MSPAEGRVTIERADVSHAAEVHTLTREFAAGEGALAGVATEQRWGELLSDDRVAVLVAWRDGEPVGYVSAVRTLDLRSGAHVVAVDDLYVRPAERDAGVEEALVRALARQRVGETIRWELREGDLEGQRRSLRLGARLRRAVVARWLPAER